MPMRYPLVAAVVLCIGCGKPPARVGVLTNTLPLTKTRVGAPSASAEQMINRDRLPPDFRDRFVRGDILGDSAEELVVLDAGLRDLFIEDAARRVLKHLAIGRNVTDFGIVPDPNGSQRILVNTDGIFTLYTPDAAQTRQWAEPHDPGRFAVIDWKGRTAVAYLLGDAFVIRSTEGQPLSRLPAPEGHSFGRVYFAALAGGRSVFVGSGSGYTQYHMVCVYDSTDTLVFQEINPELAFDFRAEDNGRAFVVTARTNLWRYTLP